MPARPRWHDGGMAAPQTVPVETPDVDEVARRRPGVGDDRVERPGQPHVVRDLGVPEALRLQPGEGREADARRAPQGQGDRLQRARASGWSTTRPVCTATACGPRSTSHDRCSARAGVTAASAGVRPARRRRCCASAWPSWRRCCPRTPTWTTRRWSGSSPTSTRRTRSEAAEFRRFTEADLQAAKLDQAKTVLSDLHRGGRGGPARRRSGADVWLRALTDVRLALGTRLGVEDDTDIEAELDAAVGRNPTSPRVGQLSVYAYLTLPAGVAGRRADG